MATSVVNSSASDDQPSMAKDYQDLRSLEEGDGNGQYFRKGPALSQSSCRRACPTSRLALALMAACSVLTLSAVLLGFQGVQLNIEKGGTVEAIKSFNQTFWTGLNDLRNKRNSTGWKLKSLEKILTDHNEKMKKANELFQEQLDNLQEDSKSFHCDLVEIKSNGSRSGCCPKDWQRFQETCYWFSSATLSWEEAKLHCEGQNAHLLIINSPEEKKFVYERKSDSYTWIGLTDVTGDWKWVDGSSYTLNRADWAANQPDHWYGHNLGGGEDCVQMFQGNAGWNDNHCSRAFKWVCEMEKKD